jgi:hypothetical protein
MGLNIFELCRFCLMCFNNIRNEEKDAILFTNFSLLILYLMKAKKQINGIFEGCPDIYW